MQRVARFKIQPPCTVDQTEEQVERRAGVYFAVASNVVIPMTKIIVDDGDVVLRLGEGTNTVTKSPKVLYIDFQQWGSAFAQGDYSHEELMRVKDRLPALFAKVALKLDEPMTVTNVLTGETIIRVAAVPTYAFIEPVIKKTVKATPMPGTIWYGALAVPKIRVYGKAAELVLFSDPNYGSWGFVDGEFSVKVKVGKVMEGDQLLGKHHAAVIEAAFRDLTKNVAEADAMPVDTQNWSLAQSRLEIV